MQISLAICQVLLGRESSALLGRLQDLKAATFRSRVRLMKRHTLFYFIVESVALRHTLLSKLLASDQINRTLVDSIVLICLHVWLYTLV